MNWQEVIEEALSRSGRIGRLSLGEVIGDDRFLKEQTEQRTKRDDLKRV